jgi:hypothetical protein
MVLSVDTPLVAADISDIRCISERESVYLLTGFANDQLVIKVDEVKPTTAKQESAIMKSVDGQARLKVMKANEIQELEAWLQAIERWPDAFGEKMIDSIKKCRRIIKHIRDGIDRYDGKPFRPSGQFAIMKMAALNVQNLPKTKSELGKEERLKNFREALTCEGGLEQMGRIVAADLVIGNNDRFRPPPNWNNWDKNSRVVWARQNLFICSTAEGFQPLGIDYTQPQDDLQYDRSMNQWSADKKKYFSTLQDKKMRRAFAEAAVLDLAGILLVKKFNNDQAEYAGGAAFKCNAVERLISGMIDGCRLIGDRMWSKLQTRGQSSP